MSDLQAGLVGHFTLAPPGTLKTDLTPRNKSGGKLKTGLFDVSQSVKIGLT